MTDTIPVYDPRGTVDAAARPLSPRRDPNGLRLAVLDNSKWNAGDLLRRAAERLEDELQLASVSYFKKDSFASAAPAALLDRIAGEHDLALTAIGD